MTVRGFNCERSCKQLFLFFIVFSCFLCFSFLYIQQWSGVNFADLVIRNNKFMSDRNKPHLVIGILSSEYSRREAVRNTWITTIQESKHRLPFRITYKFLLDDPTNETIAEDKFHKDIVYLNVTTHGWAVKFGEKLQFWLKYIWKNYPDVSLGLKMDDDVYLCFPAILYRLLELNSPTLYYGWKHGDYRNKVIVPGAHVDEMFVVLGGELIKRIAKRKYCGKPKCDNKGELQEVNYADTSLTLWLSEYNDVDVHGDNLNIMHMGRNMMPYVDRYITNYVCENFVLFHKILPDSMPKLHRLNPYKGDFLNKLLSTNNSTEHGDGHILSSAATGSLFTGYIERYLIPPATNTTAETLGKLSDSDKNIKCNNWAIVTTIQLPTKAVEDILKDKQWCLVVVADLKTPSKTEYLKYLDSRLYSRRLKYLSVKEQSTLFPLLSESIPYNSIGRKNIGFMYAIYRRAEAIWDFDDDNIGIVNLKDFGPTTQPTSYVKVCNKSYTGLVNPYPYFGVHESLTWPRGFPLQSIRDPKTVPKVCKNTQVFRVGVIQSLANVQPDVDAIYRFTRTVPFNFTSSNDHPGFIIPTGCFTPFNAQATLWFPSAFEFMPLLISVNGRVSDIWRSYIAQYFMHQRDIKLTFVRPYVTQERNAHTLIRDFNAENDLYEKGKQITDFLSRPKLNAIPYTTMTDLYENLYRRKYIELSDVKLIRAWETTFANVTKT